MYIYVCVYIYTYICQRALLEQILSCRSSRCGQCIYIYICASIAYIYIYMYIYIYICTYIAARRRRGLLGVISTVIHID